MSIQFKKIYEKYWLDIGVALLVALLFGSGLLMIKISKEEKLPLEITGGNEVKGETISIKEGSSDKSGLVNLNTATAKELEDLPGIGEKTAEKIISYREENGEFTAIEEVQEVSGIGEAKYADIEEFITVE